MLHITVWTNDPSIPQPIKDAVKAVLDAGQAVRIGSACLGHTRAEMVESAGQQYLKDEYRIHPDAPRQDFPSIREYDTHFARKPAYNEHTYLATFTTVCNKNVTHWETVVYGKTVSDAKERFKKMWDIHEIGQRPHARHPFHLSIKRL